VAGVSVVLGRMVVAVRCVLHGASFSTKFNIKWNSKQNIGSILYAKTLSLPGQNVLSGEFDGT
jgi:hypothetical protein